MTGSSDQPPIRLGLPKGRMQEGVVRLLADAGIDLAHGPREYRPRISLDGFEAKFLKPQNMIEMLHAGSRDIGFAGADWVAELGAEVVELVDTGLNPVRLVAATTPAYLDNHGADNGGPGAKPFVVASEYASLTAAWIADKGYNASVLRSFGTTEVFPPEDADYIVDVTATMATLEANNLVIVDELMASSTRLFANPAVLDDPGRRDTIERFVLVLKAVLEARKRVMVEVNVPARPPRCADQSAALHARADGVAAPRRHRLRGQGCGAARGPRPDHSRNQGPWRLGHRRHQAGPDCAVTRQQGG